MDDHPARFRSRSAELASVAANVLGEARALGASAAETEVSVGNGLNVTVRKGEVETIEYTRDKGIGITVYVGQRRGHSSTADFSGEAVRAAVEKAITIARYTAEDPCAGLADADRLARQWKDPDLHHPWDLTVERSIAIAQACEAEALAVDPRIENSDGASVSSHESEFVYANSLGFSGGYRGSRHGISCSVIAADAQGMQRDYWYTSARDAALLDPAEAVGRCAGERTVRRLGARRLKTGTYPVLFEAPVATGLIGHFVSAVSGGSLYRKSSFLMDSIGQAVFSTRVTIDEEPHIPGGTASSPFDDEGVATTPRAVVDAGVVKGYFLSSYSARKLGMTTTGNAGGNHNLIVGHGPEDFAGLLRRIGSGLLVTEMLGQGVNSVTGDYSRGAAGFWIENGEIAYPVEEITVAGNLKSMYRDIVAIGSDVDRRGSRQTGSILVGSMTVAGT